MALIDILRKSIPAFYCHSVYRIITVMRFSEYYIDKSSPKEQLGRQARHGVLGCPPILKRTLKEALWESGRVIAYMSPSKRATRACTSTTTSLGDNAYRDGISRRGSPRIHLSRKRVIAFSTTRPTLLSRSDFCPFIRSVHLPGLPQSKFRGTRSPLHNLFLSPITCFHEYVISTFSYETDLEI